MSIVWSSPLLLSTTATAKTVTAFGDYLTFTSAPHESTQHFVVPNPSQHEFEMESVCARLDDVHEESLDFLRAPWVPNQ